MLKRAVAVLVPGHACRSSLKDHVRKVNMRANEKVSCAKAPMLKDCLVLGGKKRPDQLPVVPPQANYEGEFSLLHLYNSRTQILSQQLTPGEL